MIPGVIEIYTQVWNDGQTEFFPRILRHLLFFVTVQLVARISVPPGWLLATRPTIVAGTIHGLSISIIAGLVCSGLVDLSWWRLVGLPLTVAYNISDLLFYCIPKKNMTFVVHHLCIIGTHCSVCSEAAAAIVGVGDVVWAQNLSALGFLSEIPIPLLNLRWWAQRAWKRSVRVHAVIDWACVATFTIFRIVLFPWLLYSYVLPHQAAYRAAGKLDLFVGNFCGHLIIFLLSLMWLIQLIQSMATGGRKSPNE
jgi:hypothetical protein